MLPHVRSVCGVVKASTNRLIVVGSNGSVIETTLRQTVDCRRVDDVVVRLYTAGQRCQHVGVSCLPAAGVSVPDVDVVVVVARDPAAL